MFASDPLNMDRAEPLTPSTKVSDIVLVVICFCTQINRVTKITFINFHTVNLTEYFQMLPDRMKKKTAKKHNVAAAFFRLPFL